MGWTSAKEAEAHHRAQAQHGVLHVAQLSALGCSRRTIERRLQAKHWRRLFPGVYRLTHSPKSDWHQMAMAACLWAGQDAFISGGAAARLHGLDGMEDERIVEVTVNGPCRKSASFTPVHRTDVARVGNVTKVDGIPCSTVERTLMEVAHQWPEEDADMALDSALRTRKTTLKAIRFYLAAHRVRGRRGTRRLERLVAAHTGTPKDSAQEVQFLHRVVKEHGIEAPTHNFKLLTADGSYKKIDYVWESRGVGVELHSKKAHLSDKQRRQDTEKQNLCSAAGLALYIYWYEDIRDRPGALAQEVVQALERGARSAAA